MAFPILGDEGFGFGVGQVLDALLRPEVKLDPDAFVLRIDHREGVAAEPVHMPEALGDAAVRHHDRDLVQRLRQKRPEIPVVVGAAQRRCAGRA